MEKASATGFSRVSLPPGGLIPLVAAVYALGVGLFLTIEPIQLWLLMAVTIIVTVGSDGVIRSHPNGDFRALLDTAPYLLVPAILSLAAGFFLEETVSGYWQILAALVSGGLMAAVLYGEYVSVDTAGTLYGASRFVLNVATYLCAFALYAVMYSFDTGLLPAALCSGLLSMVLAAEVMRETELMPPPVGTRSLRSLGLAAAIGLIVAEARWALYFVPLDGFLAAVFLLLFFYVASGIAQHYLTDHLNRSVATEYGLVASIGLVMIILGRLLTGG